MDHITIILEKYATKINICRNMSNDDAVFYF